MFNAGSGEIGDMTDQKLCAWCGLASAALLGGGMLVAGFVPPPSPMLSPDQVVALYRDHSLAIRIGMLMTFFGMSAYIAFVGVVSVQLKRIRGVSELSSLLQLAAGTIGVLTFLLPFMGIAAGAFRPDREPASLVLLNDVCWLLAVTAFPSFMTQWAAIANAVLRDRSPAPVYPRWVGFLQIWVMFVTLAAPLPFFFATGPFAWNGLFPFWLAGGMFFGWMAVMSVMTARAVDADVAAMNPAA